MPWWKCWWCHRVYERSDAPEPECPWCHTHYCQYAYDRYKTTRRWTLSCSCASRSGESDQQFMLPQCPDCKSNVVLDWVPLPERDKIVKTKKKNKTSVFASNA